MKVRDIMTTEVVTTTRDTPLKAAAEVLTEHRISGMPVVEGGVVVGVFSVSDVVDKQRRPPIRTRRGLARRPRAGAWSTARTVDESMSAPARTVHAYATIATAASLMLEYDVNRLPVVEHGRLIGIVSRADLVRAFVRPDAAIAGDAREQLALQQSLQGDGGEADATVVNGEVVLTGRVRRRRDAELLPRLIREIPGVVEVRSELSWSVDE